MVRKRSGKTLQVKELRLIRAIEVQEDVISLWFRKYTLMATCRIDARKEQ